MVFRDGGDHFRVVTAERGKSGRQAGFVQAKVRSLSTGATVHKRFTGGDKVDRVRFEEIPATYLYRQGDLLVLMDEQDWEQHEVPMEMVGDGLRYMKENESALLARLDGKVVGLRPQQHVVLEVVEAPDAVKGDTATGATKEAVLEGGATVKVPLFIKTGDRVKVDTDSGVYIERA